MSAASVQHLERRLQELEERFSHLVSQVANLRVRLQETHPQVPYCPHCGRAVAAKSRECPYCKGSLVGESEKLG